MADHLAQGLHHQIPPLYPNPIAVEAHIAGAEAGRVAVENGTVTADVHSWTTGPNHASEADLRKVAGAALGTATTAIIVSLITTYVLSREKTGNSSHHAIRATPQTVTPAPNLIDRVPLQLSHPQLQRPKPPLPLWRLFRQPLAPPQLDHLLRPMPPKRRLPAHVPLPKSVKSVKNAQHHQVRQAPRPGALHLVLPSRSALRSQLALAHSRCKSSPDRQASSG